MGGFWIFFFFLPEEERKDGALKMEGAVLLAMLCCLAGLGWAVPRLRWAQDPSLKGAFAEDMHLHFVKSAVLPTMPLHSSH